jgi:hypothetical protein
MSNKLLIILIFIVSFVSIGFYWLSDYKKNNDQIQVDMLSKASALPVRALTSFDFDDEAVEVKVNLYDAVDSLLVEYEHAPTINIRVMDALTYLEYYSSLSDLKMIAMQAKKTTLVVDPKHADIKALNTIKGSILGISTQASDEYLLRTVIDSQDIIGLSLDEVTISSSSERALMISDSLINFAFFESPYTAYTLSNGCGSFYDFPSTMYDVYLVPADLDNEALEKVTAYLKALNQEIETYNSKTDDDISKEMSLVFGKYAIMNDKPVFYQLVQPDEVLINRFVTYLYATNWIDDKYPYETLALEVFK